MRGNGSDLNYGPNLVEAGAAVDGAVKSRQERNERCGAAIGARDLVKLARGLPLPLAPAVRSALMAALWLIQQTALGEEGLFAG